MHDISRVNDVGYGVGGVNDMFKVHMIRWAGTLPCVGGFFYDIHMTLRPVLSHPWTV
jgi:hypothetical protein